MDIRYLYRCDGGINPSHHQAATIEVNHDLESGKVTRGLNDKFDSTRSALESIKEDYDSVIHTATICRNIKNHNNIIK